MFRRLRTERVHRELNTLLVEAHLNQLSDDGWGCDWGRLVGASHRHPVGWPHPRLESGGGEGGGGGMGQLGSQVLTDRRGSSLHNRWMTYNGRQNIGE